MDIKMGQAFQRQTPITNDQGTRSILQGNTHKGTQVMWSPALEQMFFWGGFQLLGPDLFQESDAESSPGANDFSTVCSKYMDQVQNSQEESSPEESTYQVLWNDTGNDPGASNSLVHISGPSAEFPWKWCEAPAPPWRGRGQYQVHCNDPENDPGNDPRANSLVQICRIPMKVMWSPCPALERTRPISSPRSSRTTQAAAAAAASVLYGCCC